MLNAVPVTCFAYLIMKYTNKCTVHNLKKKETSKTSETL